MTNLGTLGGSWSVANAINEMGHVVGSAADGSGQARAFLWSPATGMVDLGPGTAVAVNEFDHVVGSSGGAGDMRAFLWTPADGRIELATDARAVDLNNNGYVVGAITASGGERTVIWRTAITDADWMTYRYGLIDAHVAYGTRKAGPAHALRALLANAERATRRGDLVAAQRALVKWTTSFERWRAPGELPWQ